MPAVTIGGYFGFGNTGDELILYAVLQRFRQTRPGEKVIVLSKSPETTQEMYSVGAVQRWNPFSCLRAFVQSDAFMLGGGGLLQESSGPWNHLYYLSLIVMARVCGCKTEMNAMGIDPVRNPWNRFLTRHVLNVWVTEISVRDQESKQVLVDLGVVQPIRVVPDPVLALPVAAHATESRIALALSGREITRLPEIIQFAASLPAPVDLLVLFPAQDASLANALAGQVKGIRQIRTISRPQELLKWIGDYSLVIGSRFHALVLAAAAGIPFMGWGNQKKVENLCREKNMPYLNTDLQWDHASLRAALKRAYPPVQFKSINKSDILATQTD